MNKKRRRILLVISILIIAILACGGSDTGGEDTEAAPPSQEQESEPRTSAATNTPMPEPLPLPTPTHTPIPMPTAIPTWTSIPTLVTSATATVTIKTLSPDQQIQAAVKDAIRSSNRDVPRISKVSKLLDIITINWTINDNLTEGAIKTGAKIDIRDMLKALQEAGIEYQLVNFEGTFPLRDQLGNVNEHIVVWATYEAETVSQINWPLFLHDDIYKIAANSKQHPAFAE